MRVKYIGDYYKFSLRKGKIYEVIYDFGGFYSLIDESGEEYAFPADMFELVD